MTRRIAPIVFASLLAAVAHGWAQETTGAISGRVIDEQGLAVPGATVTVTGPQGARTALSDVQGRYSLPFLTPGTYTVRAELQGFKTVEQRNVVVQLGQRVELPLAMPVGGLEEVIEVAGTSPIVDTRSTTTGAVVSSEMLERLPIGRRVTDALYVAPGVTTTSVGQANPSLSGASGLDNLYVVDGVNITNTGYGAIGSYSIVFGSLGTATPFDFVKEIQIKTGGYEAEFGQATGGVVNMVTKSGSNDLRGSVFGYFRPDVVQASWRQLETVNGAVNTTGTQSSDGGFEVGLPIVRNHLFVFGALNPSWDRRTFIAPAEFPLASLGEVHRERTTLSYSAKATWQASNAHRFDASFFGDPSEGTNGPQRATALLGQTAARFSSIEYGGHNQTLRYDGVLSSRWLVEASFARAENAVSETPSVDEWAVTDFRFTPREVRGGIGYYEDNDGLNQQFTVKSTHLFGGHQVRYGVLYEDVDYTHTVRRTGPAFTAHDGRQTVTGASIQVRPDPVFGTIWRVTRANFNTSRPTAQSYTSFFVQDSWKATRRLTVNAGVRYEQQTLKGTIQELHTFQGGTMQNFPLRNNWAPRIGLVYDVVGNGRSKVYGNFGRFYARIPNDLAARALSADEGISRGDYFDAQLTQPVPQGVVALGVTNHFALSGAHADQIDEDARLSYKDEWVAGFEYEAFANTNLGIRYIRRTLGSALEDVAQFPMVGYELGLEGADSVEYILTNPTRNFPTLAPELGARFEDPIHDYDAVELTMDRRFSNNWMMTASYRWSRLQGTFEGFFREDNGQSDPGITSLYDFPTDDPSYTAIGVAQFGYRGDIRYLGALGAGPLPLDRPHQAKVFGNYAFDMGLSLGLGLTLGSGKPLTPLASNPYYTNAGEIPEGPRGSGIQTVDGFRRRTPFESQVNVQAAYGFTFAGTRRITVMADAFNLFNTRRALDYDAYTELAFDTPNPDFGQPVLSGGSTPQFQQPFQLRFGVRVAF
jgi:outer membrane receptor protein involved in Fe transport